MTQFLNKIVAMAKTREFRDEERAIIKSLSLQGLSLREISRIVSCHCFLKKSIEYRSRALWRPVAREYNRVDVAFFLKMPRWLGLNFIQKRLFLGC